MAAINKDSHSEAEDEGDEVAAFQNRRNNRFQNRNRNQSQGSGQRSNRYNSGNGNKRNLNGKYCFYCKIQNHTQEECRKRIKDNKPCKDKQGCAYWPKVYVTNEREINRDSSRFFNKEPDDTPHPGFKHHSAINSQFMYHFYRHLQ